MTLIVFIMKFLLSSELPDDTPSRAQSEVWKGNLVVYDFACVPTGSERAIVVEGE